MKTSTAWALVGTQFGLIIGLIVLPAGDLWERTGFSAGIAGALVLAGLAVAGVAGLRLGPALTPLPIPKEGADLVTSGVYRWVRHPIYTGVLLAALGLVVWGASFGHIIGLLGLYAVLFAKSVGEEKMLASRHPNYQAYAKKTGRLLPKLFQVQDGGNSVE
jgi:protein-S-isoprenylcysteine O-methyltransferase Ste14